MNQRKAVAEWDDVLDARNGATRGNVSDNVGTATAAAARCGGAGLARAGGRDAGGVAYKPTNDGTSSSTSSFRYRDFSSGGLIDSGAGPQRSVMDLGLLWT